MGLDALLGEVAQTQNVVFLQLLSYYSCQDRLVIRHEVTFGTFSSGLALRLFELLHDVEECGDVVVRDLL